MIQLDCPNCNHPLLIDEQFAGRTGTCKHCNGSIDVPSEAGAEFSAAFSEESVTPQIDSIEAWRTSWQKLLTPAQLTRVTQKIESNIADGKTPADLWEHLEEIGQLNIEKTLILKRFKSGVIGRGADGDQLKVLIEQKHAELLQDLKKMVAEVEQHLAINASELAKAKRDGKAYKLWIAIGDDIKSDTDVTNESQRWIPIDESFASGHQTAPSHPGCCCTVSYRKTAPDDMSIERAKDRVKATARTRMDMGL